MHVHHGTRETPARVAALGGRFHQLRLEQPLVAARGDRFVIRSIAPPDTLGGGVVLDPAPRRHGPTRDLLARLARLERGEPEPEPAPDPAPAPRRAGAAPALLAGRRSSSRSALRAAGVEPPLDAELDAAPSLAALREAGRAVRVGRALHYHPDALAEVRERASSRIVEREGAITLARLRDELGTTRKYAQALLEHLDAERVTLRRGDDARAAPPALVSGRAERTSSRP